MPLKPEEVFEVVGQLPDGSPILRPYVPPAPTPPVEEEPVRPVSAKVPETELDPYEEYRQLERQLSLGGLIGRAGETLFQRAVRPFAAGATRGVVGLTMAGPARILEAGVPRLAALTGGRGGRETIAPALRTAEQFWLERAAQTAGEREGIPETVAGIAGALPFGVGEFVYGGVPYAAVRGAAEVAGPEEGVGALLRGGVAGGLERYLLGRGAALPAPRALRAAGLAGVGGALAKLRGAEMPETLTQAAILGTVGAIGPARPFPQRFREPVGRAADSLRRFVPTPLANKGAEALNVARQARSSWQNFVETTTTKGQQYVPAQIRRTLAQLSTLPKVAKERYREIRRGWIGKYARLNMELEDQLRALSAAPPEQRAQAINIAFGREPLIPAGQPATPEIAAMSRLRESLTKVGREGVRTGRLKPSQLIENYVPNMFAYYVEQAPEELPRSVMDMFIKTGGVARISPGNYRLHRDLFMSKRYKDVILGQIRDAPYLIAKALRRQWFDVFQYDMTKALTETVDDVLPGVTQVPRDQQGDLLTRINQAKNEGLALPQISAKLPALQRLQYEEKIQRISKEIVTKQAAGAPQKEVDKLTRKLLRATKKGVIKLQTWDPVKLEQTIARRQSVVRNELAKQVPDMEKVAFNQRLIAEADELVKPFRTVTPYGERALTKDWTRLSKEKAWGAVAGRSVRKEIALDWDSLAEQRKAATTLVGKASRGLISRWKGLMVGYNPPTQFRNIVSNTIMADLDGMGYRDQIRYLSRAYKSVQQKNNWYNQAVDNAFFKTSLSGEILDDMQRDLFALGKVKNYNQYLNWLTRMANKPVEWYGGVEGIYKLARMMHAIDKEGLGLAQAAAKAQEVFFDYSEVPKWVVQARRSPFGFPFMTFMYKSIPKVMKNIALRPWKLIKYDMLRRGMQAAALKNLDMTEKEYEDFRKTLPSWLQRYGVWPLPFRRKDGKVEMTDFSYYWPLNPLLDIVQAVRQQDWKQLASETGIFGAPPAKWVVGVSTGIDPFTKRPIIPKDEEPLLEPWQKSLKLLDWAAKMYVPSWLKDKGFRGTMLRYLSGDLDPYDNQYSIRQPVGKFFGANVYAFDVKQARLRKLAEFDRRRAEVRRAATIQLREGKTGAREKMRKRLKEINQEETEALYSR